MCKVCEVTMCIAGTDGHEHEALMLAFHDVVSTKITYEQIAQRRRLPVAIVKKLSRMLDLDQAPDRGRGTGICLGAVRWSYQPWEWTKVCEVRH